MSKKQSKQPKDLPTYNTGDPVLGKIRGYPPWPGIVIDPSDAPPNVINQQPTNKKAASYCVLFFPHGDYGWLGPKELSMLRPHEVEAFLADGQKRNAELREGYKIAQNPAVWMSARAATDAAAREAEEEAQVDQLQSDGEGVGGAGGGEGGGEESGEGEEGMDIDVGLGLEAPKKKRKPAASAPKKRKRESDAAALSTAATGATAEAKPTKAAAAAKPKKAASEPRTKKAAAVEKEKKPRKNGSAKSKVAVESEDEMGGGANAAGDETDAPGGSSKKDTGGSPPPAKKVRREKEDEDDSKSGDPQSLKVRDWRHKLQKTFLSNKGVPKSEAMAELDALFTTVEQYEEMTIEQLQFSKIGKVMRHIAALPEDKVPPRDAEFGFRSRARALVDKWHRILNANKLGSGNGNAGGHASPVSAAPPATAVEKVVNGGENEEEAEGRNTARHRIFLVDETPAADPAEAPAAVAITTTTAAADMEMEPSTTTLAIVAEPLSTGAAAGGADAEGEQDQDANAEAEDASTHVEDVVMTEG